MAFHWPGKLGDEKVDLEAMNALRGDKFYFNDTDSATGYSIQASLPYDNFIWNLHFNSTASSIAAPLNISSSNGNNYSGMNNTFEIILRFLL